MKIRFRTNICWLIITAFLLVNFSTSFGDIICIGENGHIEIEYANMPCCDDQNSSCLQTDDSSLQTSNHTDCCENCLDIPLISAGFIKRPFAFKASGFLKSQNSISLHLIPSNIVHFNSTVLSNKSFICSNSRDHVPHLLLITSPILIC